MALLAFAAGCTDTVTFYGRESLALHGRRVLLLEPSLVAPTPEAVQRRVQEQVRAALEASPDLGGVLPGAQARAQAASDLPALSAYEQFANSLSLAGVSDPELAVRLGGKFQVGLLAVVQPVYQPCTICESGDELWLVGQVVDATDGKLVFRAHISKSISQTDEAALAQETDDLLQRYLEEQTFAFRLRSHRVRFDQLRKLAGR